MNKEKAFENLEAEDSDRLELEEFRRDRDIRANLDREFALLRELFPTLRAEDIPDEAFENTENGKGLAGQYALCYLRKQKEAEETEKTNEKNSRSAPPKVGNLDGEGYFTPDMVKTMSDSDIRRNYKAIMKSMEKWAEN